MSRTFYPRRSKLFRRLYREWRVWGLSKTEAKKAALAEWIRIKHDRKVADGA